MIHLFHVEHPLNPDKKILAILTEKTFDSAMARAVREFGTLAKVLPINSFNSPHGEYLVVTLL